MSRNHFFRIALFVVCLGSAAIAQNTPRDQQGILPITTGSTPARQLFIGGLVKLQNLHGPEAMQDLRKAIQLDPDFALANIMISFESVDPSVDPAEKVAARDRANAAKSKVSRGEQLDIELISKSITCLFCPSIKS